ncbi:MAG: hypothetical protein ACKVOI_15305 [Dongiaceae bacterium]
MKILRTVIAIGGLAAMLAIVSMADGAHAADKSSPASPVQAKKPKPAPGSIILVLCRPYQTCPP